MNFTDSPFEKMMQQVPRAHRPEIQKAPPGSPCCGCSYWQGMACVEICSRELTEPGKEGGGNFGKNGNPAEPVGFAGREGATARCRLRANLARSCGAKFATTRPEVEPMEKTSRELTRQGRAAIRKLVTGMCANYDSTYGCLPLECECYIFGKWWTGAYCKYFENAVLPLDPVLEATLTGREAPALDTCAACGKPFLPQGRQAYCSPACASNARKKRQREYMRKKRAGC